jgi:DNA replicative helicase MCM subunit Mcm2 (Cdc46/Mcm family)
MADSSPEELIDRWQDFYQESGLLPRLMAIADAYPEERSLELDFTVVDRFDSDLALKLLERPQASIYAAEEGVRRLLPPSEEVVDLRIRVRALPKDSRVEIRDLRSKHLGTLLSIQGLVRKVTEVRPKVVEAIFQCLRCNAVIKEDQEGMGFREPLECYEDQGGCKRSSSATKFILLSENSRFIDTQKIEIQEAPEGLRGGEQPQRLTAYLDDDLTGKINPGARVILNGVLRSVQKGRAPAKSTLFDLFLDCNSLELQQVEFEEIEVTPEDVASIKEEAEDPEVFTKIVSSIAPSIFGLQTEKEALALQLFGGIPKFMPDGRRIRGDIHILLVGDPGCLVGDERITLGNGTVTKLERMGTRHMQRIETRVRLGAGLYRNDWATRFHRYDRQPILEVVTESGKSIKGTYNHPLLVWDSTRRCSAWRRLDELRVGDRVRVAPSIKCWKQALVPTGWGKPTTYHKSWHVKIPKFVDERLAAILGYLLGNGWATKRRVGFVVASGEADLATKLVPLFKAVFGVAPAGPRIRSKGLAFYYVNRTPVARWLQVINDKRVPEPIFQSRNSVVAAFLRWLYEADGCCFCGGTGKTAIQLRSTSLELLRDVQNLFLRWGIYSRILWESSGARPHELRGGTVRGGPSGSLVIRRSSSILRFAAEIGFESRKKRARLRALVRRANSMQRKWSHQMSERIVSIKRAGFETVYDIEVPRAHRFIANGIISHNTAKSELLSYMSRLSPRGVYASGQAASGPGLTAAAVRDEFGEGRWTLEAGAMVLSDKGLACIDELDKMNPNDRSSIHEILEQQRLSVAKAGITATLQARCAMLAAANPRFGRFDEHKYISEQLDLPVTLLSRLDCIFPIIDRPESGRDRSMADHILRAHLVGEMLRRQEVDATLQIDPGLARPLEPYFRPEFLRKYVAYAKRVYPIMTPDAMKVISDKYLQIRREGEKEGGAVPITPRQLEGFVRLAEASARARLSPLVSAEDAERAVRIVEYWLQRVTGVEGRFDIDIVATGVSTSQREQIIILRDIIQELAGTDGTANLEDILERAEQRGIPPMKVEQWLKHWSQQGEVYSPARNKFRLVTRS